MSSKILGLDSLLKKLDLTDEQLDNAMDDIAKETSTMIHAKAIVNVSGPKNSNSKKTKGNKKVKSKTTSNNRSNSFNYYSRRIAISLGIRKLADIPYPVSVNTGTLRRSLKLKKLGKGSYKIYADLNIANYAIWVHEGTTRMKPRPFLENGLEEVLEEKKYIKEADKIIKSIINS